MASQGAVTPEPRCFRQRPRSSRCVTAGVRPGPGPAGVRAAPLPTSQHPASSGDRGGGARSTRGRSATCWAPSDRAAAWSGPRRPRSPNSECPVCFQATPGPDRKNRNSSRNTHPLSKTVRSAAREHFLTTARGVVCAPVHVCGGGCALGWVCM